jgi:2-amino-4-hydroxy-6-hydroxymethyldihydropteridine diphosphokinase
MPEVFLGLGSNLGDCESTLHEAFREIRTLLEGARLSRLWRSRAMYVIDQPDFVNAAVTGTTRMAPLLLLRALQDIESRFGRDRARERAKGPRKLDIDILLYDSLVMHEPELVLPHPGLRERAFALIPLLELDASLRDPGNGRLYSEVLESLPDQGIYLLEGSGYHCESDESNIREGPRGGGRRT